LLFRYLWDLWQCSRRSGEGIAAGRDSSADRQAILQILRDTKADLPESFK